MKTLHATETQLALFQTGDLGVLEGLRVRWHVNACERCAGELAAFEEARAILETESTAGASILRDLDWQRLSAEMTANIHLGLEAGECVRPARSTTTAARPFSWELIWRPGLAVALATLILFTGTWVFTNRIRPLPVNFDGQVVLEARPGSLQIRSNGAAFSLVRASTASSGISMGSGGSLQARDIDEDTGQVTIYHVYAK